MQLGIKGMLIFTKLLEKRSHSRSTFLIMAGSGKPAKGPCSALLCVQRRSEEGTARPLCLYSLGAGLGCPQHPHPKPLEVLGIGWIPYSLGVIHGHHRATAVLTVLYLLGISLGPPPHSDFPSDLPSSCPIPTPADQSRSNQ